MNGSDFITVFDAAEMGYRNWWFPAFGLIFVAFGILTPRLTAAGVFPLTRNDRVWAPRLFAGLGILWTIVSFAATVRSYLHDRDILFSGHACYIEGIVENFISIPSKDVESFTVHGIPLRFSDYVITTGLTRTGSYAGPIRQGLYVRIWYAGNDILKLQVPKLQINGQPATQVNGRQPPSN